MSKTLTVEVTQADMDAGLPGEARHCPIALAVIRATGRKYVRVASALQVGRTIYEIGDDARYFMDDFDNGYLVSPAIFTFEPFK